MEAILSAYRQNKLLGQVLNATVILLLLIALYQQVFAREDLPVLSQTFQKNLQKERLPWLLLTIALMPANWAFETIKWRQFTQIFSTMSFWQSFRAVLAGVTVSLFTPNRIGEYGGRILLAEQRHGWRIILATLLGSFSQMIILFSAGLVGFLWFSYNHLELKTYLLFITGIVGFLFILSLTVAFFRIQAMISLIHWLVRNRIWQSIRRQIIVLRMCTDRQKWQAIGWAAVRYVTYSVQYWLLLEFLGIHLPVLAAFGAIATIFLIQTGVPLPPVGAFLARAEIALFIWGHFGANEISILVATFGLFIINLALPALLGAIFIVKIKVLKLYRL